MALSTWRASPRLPTLTGGSFTAEYRWYMEPNPTSRTVAFRLGIQSAQWAASQTSFTAIRSGEQTWDLILVNVMAGAVPNAWNTVNVDKDNGLWYLYGQAGNGNWVGIAGSAPPGGSTQKRSPTGLPTPPGALSSLAPAPRSLTYSSGLGHINSSATPMWIICRLRS
ncbi:MAG: hypothetical protein IPH12_01075 [Saprospirales bacterium]|nr:hypothetical protein [Saprospirales bacterium]